MSSVRNPILRTLHIPYELDQFIKIENIDTNVRYPDVLVKYLSLGINKALDDIRDFPNNFYSKAIAVPAEFHDIIVDKARENKTSYNNILIEYLILGVKSVKTEDRFLNMWINELDKSLLDIDSIHNIKNLNSKLEELVSKKSELEEEVKELSDEIATMRLLISEQQTKEYFKEKLKK
jgi:cell division protein FtsB